MASLMGHTLPTLVGMGVVGRVAEKALGSPKPPRKKAAAKRKTKVKTKTATKTKAKSQKGPRGGRYTIRKGRKVYAKKRREWLP